METGGCNVTDALPFTRSTGIVYGRYCTVPHYITSPGPITLLNIFFHTCPDSVAFLEGAAAYVSASISHRAACCLENITLKGHVYCNQTFLSLTSHLQFYIL